MVFPNGDVLINRMVLTKPLCKEETIEELQPFIVPPKGKFSCFQQQFSLSVEQN